jgi:hypothetical protein
MTTPSLFDGLSHDGETFDAKSDGARLNAQTQRVFDVVKDGAKSGPWEYRSVLEEVKNAG